MTDSAGVGAMILTEPLYAATKENSMKKTFTILHTNDVHMALIGTATVLGVRMKMVF